MADSSSREKDPKWKAAINSIATTTVYGASATKPAATQPYEDGDFRIKPKKANACPDQGEERMSLKDTKKKPNLCPGRGINGSSKEFKKGIKSIAVDGSDVFSAAMEAAKRASSRLGAN
ncbi:hypothetical protein Bca101_093301 [Brassica carinata]